MSQQENNATMKRELSTVSVMFIAVGAMVGSGVFSMTGVGVTRAGQRRHSLVLCGGLRIHYQLPAAYHRYLGLPLRRRLL